MGNKKVFDYQNDYNREHYARMSVLVDKDKKEVIEKSYAEKGYKSFSAYVKALIEKDMQDKDKC